MKTVDADIVKEISNYVIRPKLKKDTRVILDGFLRDDFTIDEDCKIPFHPYYDVIKLPHHGTKSHYYDFTNIVNDNSIFLIPNGYIRRWPIARQYAMDANEKAIKVICAHHNACMSSHPTCQCKKHRCIYPQRYTDIKKMVRF